MKKLTTHLLILIIFLFTNCKENATTTTTESAPTPKENKLGDIEFDFTGNTESVKHFEKGLLLLHNFEFADSREAFLAAQEADSSMVMAVWGEAMTHNHPLWRQQEYEEGNAALAKLGETAEDRIAKIPTEIERDYFSAVEILYSSGDKKERDKLYSERMSELHKRYPNNHEIASLYALSILGAVPVGRDIEAYEKSAAVVQGIIEKNPKHPGALHYLIHSYDDPDHAHKALFAANNYSKVAADAAHALHMPSHIYVAVGMWDEVIDCNIASWDASVKRKEAKGLDDDPGSYHALHWRMYGHLQKEQDATAKEIMQQMKAYIEGHPTKRARNYYIAMKANYLMETGDWKSEIADYECDMKGLNIVSKSAFNFVEGMKAYLKKDDKKLASIIDTMQTHRKKAMETVTAEGVPMCSASGANRYAANQSDIDHAQIFEYQLLALQNWKSPKSEEFLKKATDLQDVTNFSFGPPILAKPSFELYADWLLENNRLEEALAMYEKGLEKGPRRNMPLVGKMEILKKMGKMEEAKEIEKELAEIKKTAKEKEI